MKTDCLILNSPHLWNTGKGMAGSGKQYFLIFSMPQQWRHHSITGCPDCFRMNSSRAEEKLAFGSNSKITCSFWNIPIDYISRIFVWKAKSSSSGPQNANKPYCFSFPLKAMVNGGLKKVHWFHRNAPLRYLPIFPAFPATFINQYLINTTRNIK